MPDTRTTTMNHLHRVSIMSNDRPPHIAVIEWELARYIDTLVYDSVLAADATQMQQKVIEIFTHDTYMEHRRMIEHYYESALNKRSSMCMEPRPCYFPDCSRCIHLSPIVGSELTRVKLLVEMSMQSIEDAELSDVSMKTLQERAYYFIVREPGRNFVGANVGLYTRHQDSVKAAIYEILLMKRLVHIPEIQKVGMVVRMEMESWIHETLRVNDILRRLRDHFYHSTVLGLNLYTQYLDVFIQPICHVFEMVKAVMNACDPTVINTKRLIKPLLYTSFSQNGYDACNTYKSYKHFIYIFIANFLRESTSVNEPNVMRGPVGRHYA